MPDRAFPVESETPARWGWRSGARAFGARRSGGRAHAGCDLYAPAGTPVRAVAPGTVTRGPYRFYAGTYALEVDHGPFLARYGEVAPGARVAAGDTVYGGERIAEVGHLRGVSVPSDMLHFELYAKGPTGALSRRLSSLAHPDGRPFRRRRDLIDPAPFLDAWAAGRPDPFPTLWRGHRGAAVERLQVALTSRAAYAGKADGDFGPATEAAVRAYQRSRGLAPDGVAGPVTCLPLGLASLSA